ncbi:MAG: C1 family peptidase [Alphaproteobacteria bacterium]|nr:C1 family peptidase [Alphaproteobacteria bacterium]
MRKLACRSLLLGLIGNFYLLPIGVSEANYNTTGFRPAEEPVLAHLGEHLAEKNSNKLLSATKNCESTKAKLDDTEEVMLIAKENYDYLKSRVLDDDTISEERLEAAKNKYKQRKELFKSAKKEYDLSILNQEKSLKKSTKSSRLGIFDDLQSGLSSVVHSVFGSDHSAAPALSASPAVIAPAAIIELPNFAIYQDQMVEAHDWYNQLNLGSCTANSLAFVLRYLSVLKSASPKEFRKDKNPARLDISRLYQYWETRYLEAKLMGYDPNEAVKADNGGSMAGGILAADKYGVTPENIVANWDSSRIDTPDMKGKMSYVGYPYTDDLVKSSLAPSPEAVRLAYDLDNDGINKGSAFDQGVAYNNDYAYIHKNLGYKDLTTSFRSKSYSAKPKVLPEATKQVFINQVVSELQKGRPFYFGVMLDDSFMNDVHGFIPTPKASTFRATGGHAIAIVGYGQYNIAQNDKTYYFKFVNSWDYNWGDNGCGYLDAMKYVAEVNVFMTEGFSVWLN